MKKAAFFNPTKVNHGSIPCILLCFSIVKELRFTPLGLRYISDASRHLDQADSYNIRRGKNGKNFFAKIRRLFFAMQYSGFRSYLVKHHYEVAIAWNARSDVRFIFMQAARDAGLKLLFLELSPFPNSIAVDANGINYLNTVPRDLDFYVSYKDKSNNWFYLKKYIAQRAGNIVDATNVNLLKDPFIFVALQTEGDSQLVDFGGNYRTVASFLTDICMASNSLKAGRKILVKEHPGNKESLAHLIRGFPNVKLVNDVDTIDLIIKSELVLTVNSSVGLESMILGKPVAASGLAFWAIPKISYKAENFLELKYLFAMEKYEYDVDLRSAFLNFLDQEYFIHLNWQADGRCRIPPAELNKVKNTIN